LSGFEKKMVLEGMLHQYNKSVLKELPIFNSLSSITLATGGILENPLYIHLAHIEHYRNAFAIPLQHRGGIHAEGPEGWNWESGGTKEEFLVAIHHHHIPAKYPHSKLIK